MACVVVVVVVVVASFTTVSIGPSMAQSEGTMDTTDLFMFKSICKYIHYIKG